VPVPGRAAHLAGLKKKRKTKEWIETKEKLD
jgi:hypothetical protein